MDVQALVFILAVAFSGAALFFGTQNGYYDTEYYHGDGSSH
jgi:hypothetical protein